MRWLPGEGGPILCATKTGTAYEGYSIDINNSGNLTFTVGNSSAYSSIAYDIDSVTYYRGYFHANKGWTHITAVWSAGEYMKLYVNGEEEASNQSSIVKTHSFPDDSIFLCKDWSHNYFQGSLHQFRLFSGALSDTTIKGIPNKWEWPTYQGEVAHRSVVTVDIEGDGHIDLGVDFNVGYRYTNTITAIDTTTSFPDTSTVDLTFQADAGWHVHEVFIDNIIITPTPLTYSYDVKDDENGSVRVIFQQ